MDGEKEEDKEEASSDEDESTPDREHQTQKEKTDTNPVAKVLPFNDICVLMCISKRI